VSLIDDDCDDDDDDDDDRTCPMMSNDACPTFSVAPTRAAVSLSPPSERSEWRRYCFRSMCLFVCVCLCPWR